MRVGCLYFPHFAVQVEVAADNSMVGKPIIIGGLPYEQKPVYDASKEAMEYGVRQGIPLREVYSLCPQGLFLPVYEEKYTNVFTAISTLIADYSSVIEAKALGSIFVDLSYAHNEAAFAREISQVVEEQFYLHTSISVASNKFTAWVASQIARPGEVITIPEGKERTFLHDLPINFVPASLEILRRFELLGIYRMGQLADLPLDAVHSEFGNKGKQLWELSNGIDSSMLVPWRKTSTLKEQIWFELPADSVDRVLSSAGELLEKLTLRLKQRWQYCRQLTISLLLINGKSVVEVFHFKEATSSREMMLRHVKQYLVKASLTASVSEMRLTLSHLCSEEGKQASFPDQPVREKSRLSTAVNRLQQRYGKDIVKRAVLKENSVLPEDSFFFINFNS